LSSARKISEEFLVWFNDLVEAYGALLRLCEHSFPIWHKKVDLLLQSQYCPKKLKSELPRNLALMRYLFSMLDKPKWFAGLKKQGFFDFDESINGGTWPQVNYLIRIADQLPDDVLQVMLAVDSTDAWLIRGFTDVAMKMPQKQCSMWAKHLTEKISSDVYNVTSFTMYQVPKFLFRMVELKSDTVFDLLAIILEILETKKKYDKFGTRMDRYHYQQVLKEVVPAVATLDLSRTVDFLANLLERIIEIGGNPHAPKGQDCSSVHWLPAIEDHPQNQDFSLEGSIALSLRSLVESSLNNEGRLDEWLEWLNRRESTVYLRMSVHFVRCFGDEALLKEWLLRKELFDDSVVRHEYLLLLQQGFPLLTMKEQEQILIWINDVSLDDYVPEEYQERHKKWQLYRRLAFIEAHLRDRWKVRFDDLKMEVGGDDDSLDRLSFDRWSDGACWVKDKSPLSATEIDGMDVSTLVEYLQRDVPVDDVNGITGRELQNAIANAVEENPAKYFEQLALLKNPDIKPLYISGVTKGLLKAESGAIPADSLLDWFLWCVERTPWTGQYGEKTLALDHNDNKKRILNHLDSRMGSKAEHPLILEFRDQVFQVVAAAMNDPDPVSFEAWSDYHAQCINSVRGVAMEAALGYGLWILRNKPEDEQHSLDDVPELKSLLKKRLDPQEEPSPAVRTAFGLHLPQLCWMDRQWVADNLALIFPETADNVFYAETWKTYLLYSRCYRDTFSPLSSLYQRAAESVDIEELEEDGSSRMHIMRLSTHYVLLYAWELIELDGLLSRFMRNANPAYQSEALRFAGSFMEGSEDLPEVVQKRFVTFFEWWEREIAPASDKGWEAFPNWFKSPLLSKVWKIERLVSASKYTTFSYQSDDVLKALVCYMDDFPLKALEVTANYIEQQWVREQQWALDTRKSLPEILRTGHHHDNEQVKRKADDLLGKLVSAGFLKYREMAEE